MFNKSIADIYKSFCIHFYNQILPKEAVNKSDLTMVEAFSMQCIVALNSPTVAEFAAMMGISAPNAAYKVGSLLEKGYIEKIRSERDHREYHLTPTEKYLDRYKSDEYLETVTSLCKERFSEEDMQKFDEMLCIIGNEILPEAEKVTAMIGD